MFNLNTQVPNVLNYTVTQRTQCRLCGSENPTRFLSFDSVPFFDEVVTLEGRGQEFSYPMELYFCAECSSVQTQHDVNLQKYYHSYQYVASQSPFIRKYMQSLADHCQASLGLRPGDRVIEVGAADGYLLSLFKKKGAQTLGFEAAENLCQLASNNDVNVINALFTKESLELVPEEFKTAQLLVLLHTFDHLYDPAPFLETVHKVLDPKRGVFLIEVHDLQDIYAKHETALFGHEHATYLHYGSMRRFLRRHGFRIVDFNFLPKEECRGSSMLIAATPEGSELVTVPNLTAFESPELDKLSTFHAFQAAVSRSFARLRQHVENGKSKGMRFAGYGGWGRGVTTLAMAGLTTNHLEFVVDGNRNLHGCYTPVSSLLIVGPDSITKALVDEIIVFNYAYINEIKNTLSTFIQNGGRVVSVIDLLRESDRPK
jgi:2-polyprenyl-3-methyl-5-hydroxy-6-metoxy-1,4-benzoquinol methylase